ncbi:MAG: hypothetical protein IKA22_13545 [Lentisphaeria bacterium]|nr:hypothetical protein [Lentisphaeria bacterium]
MKTLLLLIAIAVAAYFLYFNKSNEPEEKTASAKAKTAAVSKKSPAKKEFARPKASDFPENTLCRKLMELNEKKFSYPLAENDYYKYPESFNVRHGQLLINRNKNILQEIRKLTKYTESGINYTGDWDQELPWLDPMRKVAHWLLISAEVNLFANRKDAALKDFEDLSKIFDIFLSGNNSCIMHFVHAAYIDKTIRTVLQRCNFSENEKNNILTMLPTRQKYADNLRKAHAIEKKIIIYTQNACKDNNKEVIESLFNFGGMTVQDVNKFKKIPSKRLNELFDKHYNKICDEFEAGTLTSNTKLNFGSPEENTIMMKFFSPNGIIKLSQRLK